MTQAPYKEHETHAVTEETNCGPGGKRGDAGQRSTASECQRKIDRTGRQALDHRDLQRVGRTELAGEIVVDAPRYAGKNDQHAAPVELWAGDAAFRPGEQYRAGEDRHGAKKDAAVDVLAENKPGYRHRGEALGVEQKGAARGGRECEAGHEQGRAENAAEQYDRGKPWD